jgi:hypothetical protein
MPLHGGVASHWETQWSHADEVSPPLLSQPSGRLTCRAQLDQVDKHYPRRWPVPARQQE